MNHYQILTEVYYTILPLSFIEKTAIIVLLSFSKELDDNIYNSFSNTKFIHKGFNKKMIKHTAFMELQSYYFTVHYRFQCIMTPQS